MVYAEALVILHGYERSAGRMHRSGRAGKPGWSVSGQYRTVTLTGTGIHAC